MFGQEQKIFRDTKLWSQKSDTKLGPGDILMSTSWVVIIPFFSCSFMMIVLLACDKCHPYGFPFPLGF